MDFDTNFVFQKERSIGAIINDTITFSRSNFRDILEKTWKVVLPFFILMIGANILYLYLFSSLLGNGFGNFDLKTVFSGLVYILVSLFYTAIMQLAVSVYIMKYIEGNKITAIEIKDEIYRRIVNVMGMNFLYVIIIIVGFLILIVPGIYFSVILLFAIPILIYERQSISDSISKSFDLVKDNWWATFGSLIMISFFIIALSFAFSMLSSTIGIVESLFQKKPDILPYTNTIFNDISHLIISIISWVIYAVFMYFVNIAISLIYFDLKEKKDQTFIYKKLDSIGNE